MHEDERLILALDVPDKHQMFQLLRTIDHPGCYVKVGMELFYQEGSEIVRALKDQGYKVFLDLKLHDIPNTVHRAMQGLARLGADMVNVHAAGGSEMMRAAIEGLEAGAHQGQRPLCLAVTQLTSTNQGMLDNELWIHQPIADVIAHYASLAAHCGLDGAVCSAWEAASIKKAASNDFLAVTPGIRLAGDAAGDQKRVATPSRAKALGSDYIVVGRSITAAADPANAYQQVSDEWRKTEWNIIN